MSVAYFEGRLRDAYRGYGVAWPGTTRGEPTPSGHPFMSMADAVRIGGAMLAEFNQASPGAPGGGILRKEYDRGCADGTRQVRMRDSETVEFEVDEARREGEEKGYGRGFAHASWICVGVLGAYSLLTYMF